MDVTKFSTEDKLAYGLALDVCDRWRLEKGITRKMLSLADLTAIREWASKSGGDMWKFPSLRALAVRGIDILMAQLHHVPGLAYGV
jgi:hypothetical protein